MVKSQYYVPLMRAKKPEMRIRYCNHYTTHMRTSRQPHNSTRHYNVFHDFHAYNLSTSTPTIASVCKLSTTLPVMP